MAFIQLKDVLFSYDGKITNIDHISLSIERGEYIAIVGKNGSGKSTFAKLLNGLIIPDKGEIIVDGLSSNEKKNLFEIRKKVGVVFQNPDNQMVASIVEDDVAFGPENLGLPREEIAERIDFALKATGMEKFRTASPERLSGGQKQRVAIAGVLALKPDVLVLDESTAMLDPVGRKEVLAVAEKANKENGATVIAITHYMEEVTAADRVLVFDKGRIAMQGTPKEIFAQKEEIKKLGLTLPPASQIADGLILSGVKIKEGVLTREELAEELCALMHKN